VQNSGANDGARTHDIRDHNPTLYLLSYVRHENETNLAVFLIGACEVNSHPPKGGSLLLFSLPKPEGLLRCLLAKIYILNAPKNMQYCSMFELFNLPLIARTNVL
jgi:hypothetical protein